MKTNRPFKFAIAAFALFELAIAASSYALVPVSWNASVSNAWENALNWTPALEPTNNTFDVEIGLLTTAPCNFSSAFQIDALTLSNSSAQLNLVPGTTLAFTSDVTNNGTILVNTTAAANQTKLRFDTNGMLGGSGSVNLNGAGQFNYADVDIQNFTVTHGANHTIHGNGTIIGFNSGTLINNGAIIGDDSSGAFMQLDLANTSNQNNATIKATNGGALGFFGGTIDQTGGGTFLADGTNSVVQFGGGSIATLIGGTTNTANSGLLLGVLTIWQGVTNNGTVQIPANDIIVVTGTGLTNNSTILVNTTAAANQTKLRFDANGTLDGSGSVNLNGAGQFNYADVDIQNFTVTHGANHTIHGNGTIIGFNGGTLINNGTIIGDDSSGAFMQLDLANTTNQNNATIKAINGGALGFFSGTIDQTGGGTFLADGNGSIVLLGGGSFVTVIGGILNTANGGLIEVNGGGVILSAVTNNGTVQIPAGDTIGVTGTGLTNNGTILVNTTDVAAQTRLRFDADGTLGGEGSVSLNGGGGYNFAGLDCNAHAVINGANHTIKGNGNIFMSGGTLTNNGIIAPGLSPGHLDYSGTLTLGSTSNLVFEIGGTTQVTDYDLLSKSDNAAQTLGGNLVVRLINGFTPASTDTFTILTTQTTLQGAFSNIASGGQLATADGQGMFTVTYSGQNNVVLSNFVAVSPSSKVVTVSTHAPVKDSKQTVSCTFTINGTDPTNVIIRGLGASFGGLSDPVLTLRDSNGVTIASNDNWKSTQQTQIEATGLAPTNDKESAIVITLVPGTYTAILNGQKKSSGIGLVDVHDLSLTANSALAIMSGLGFVGNRDEGLFGDFTIGGSDGGAAISAPSGGKVRVLIRVLGPSIEGLQDPTLELDNANGTQIFFNDNWQDSQASQIQATGLAPSDSRESAIVANLDPGDYIAVVRGKVTGKGKKAKLATGFARVEVYQLPDNPVK
jgi:hypothetical protein